MLKFFVAIQSKLAEARNEEGQTMAEYGVILALIAVVCIGAVGLLGQDILNAFNNVVDGF